jgi:hypothetical protein
MLHLRRLWTNAAFGGRVCSGVRGGPQYRAHCRGAETVEVCKGGVPGCGRFLRWAVSGDQPPTGIAPF